MHFLSTNETGVEEDFFSVFFFILL